MWALSSFPALPAGATTGPAIDYSFAGYIGHGLRYIFAPVGFNWQISLALIPAFAARETDSWRKVAISFGNMFVMAYVVSLPTQEALGRSHGCTCW